MNTDYSTPQIIAYYLPQYHPTKFNDENWSKGFTEWTNVGKAKPLFKGHDQPRIPADLGYYDLRLPVVREQQAELAREAGVTAFCYWHYWFGNGKRLLADVFDEVLESGKPDFPFCLGWANHSWFAKKWDKTAKDRILMEQTYPGIEDERAHFDFLLKAFKDERYVKIDGKPFFLIFDPFKLPQGILQHFREWAKEAGFPDLYIVANSYDVFLEPEYFTQRGYDAVTYSRFTAIWAQEYEQMNIVSKYWHRAYRVVKQLVSSRPRGARNYAKDFHKFITPQDRRREVIPQIMPQWDHSPRSGDKASIIYYNSHPEYFYEHALEALNAVKDKPAAEQILILKSWNEWGEGNYMEPDVTNGDGYIKALKKAIKDTIK